MDKRPLNVLGATMYRGGDRPRRAVNEHHPFVLQVLIDCYWSHKLRYQLEDVELVVDLLRPLPGKLQLSIYDTAYDEEPIEELEAAITGKQVRVPWKVLQDTREDEDELTLEGHPVTIAQNEQSRLYFDVRLMPAGGDAPKEGAQRMAPDASSGRTGERLLHVIDKLHVQLVDDDDKPLGGYTATVTLPDGRERQLPVAADGMLWIGEIPGGSCHIDTGLPDKATLDVLTLDHADDPAQLARVPNLFIPPLPLPADAFADPDDDDMSDPFTLDLVVIEEPDEPSEEPEAEPSDVEPPSVEGASEGTQPEAEQPE